MPEEAAREPILIERYLPGQGETQWEKERGQESPLGEEVVEGVLSILNEVSPANVTVRGYKSQSEHRFEIFVSSTPRVDEPYVGGPVLTDAPRIDRPPQDLPSPAVHQEVDWPRWHELVDLRGTTGLTAQEQVEFDQIAKVVEELDAQEDERARGAVDGLVSRHEQVIASIDRLTKKINSLVVRQARRQRKRSKR